MLVTVVPIADMRVGMGNRFVPMRMRVPVGTICSHPVRFVIGMLVGMVLVLVARVMEVFVFMPHLVMAMPMCVVFIEQQYNATHHQDARGDHVEAECFFEGKDSKPCSNKRCRRKNH